MRVAALVRRHVLREDGSFGLGRVPGRPALALPGGQVLAQRRPCALQRTVDRCDADVEHLGNLGGRPVQHLAHDEHGALARRQQLDDGQESQLDSLPADEREVRLIGCGR